MYNMTFLFFLRVFGSLSVEQLSVVKTDYDS